MFEYETSQKIFDMVLLIAGSDDWIIRKRIHELNNYVRENLTFDTPLEQFREGYITLWDNVHFIKDYNIELYKTINDVFSGRA